MRLLLLNVVLAAATLATAAETTNAPGSDSTSQTGTAAFYSTRMNGRITASGARFSSTALTMAHRELPLGSKVKVTNLANNRSVILRVNDRGPFTKGRDISVTRRAAQKLGFVRSGVTQVRITPVS